MKIALYLLTKINILSTDAKGNVSTTEYSALYNYAFPTKVTTPIADPTGVNGSNTAFTTEMTYDPTTGLPLTNKDANGQITTLQYDPVTLRPIRVLPPTGAGISETIYHDEPNNYWVKNRTQIDANNWAESITYFDGLGRAKKAEKVDAQGNIFTETEFDYAGRPKRTTNPYRANEAKIWTTNVYDESSRVKEVILPDGAKVKTDYGVSTTGTNIGTVVTITDQALKQRRSITNAIGELTRVDEPNVSGNLGTIANPTQPTYYNYNGIGKMTKVTQGVQSRYFLYDSFGRLLRVRQPEQNTNNSLNTTNNPENNQWSTGFSYDDNSNVITATDAKGVVMTNIYDNLNRLKTRSYSDGTPTVSSKYDNLPFGKGRPIEVSSSISTTKTTSFNNLGKPLNYQQITDGQTYTSTYQYDSVGTLISETYPSGRVVRNEYNSDGELSRVSGQVGTQTRTFANGFSYSTSGTVERMRLGNGRWETSKFNNRLQLTEIGLGYSATNASLWKTTLEYGVVDVNGNVDVSKNSGNLAKQITSVSGMTNLIVQTYKYDSLDRILEAKETTNNQQSWSQNFGYDRYGNRTSFNQLIGQNQQTQTPTVDVNTNRFTTGQGFVYDFNGNLVQDADGKQFTFNGDNKQTQIKDANNNVIGTYFYDGNGARIKKITNTETTIFVYSGGKLIAEYSTQQATIPSISYLTNDHLGSPRVITDQNGEVISRRDFMPFGEELNSGIGGRETTQKYNATNDEIRQKFTGYQKDQESGLDFAEARMYKNNLGRFTTVDPLLASGKSANPQSFNRYAYTLNNPINLVDPSGLISASTGAKGNTDEDEKKKKPKESLIIDPCAREMCAPPPKPPRTQGSPIIMPPHRNNKLNLDARIDGKTDFGELASIPSGNNYVGGRGTSVSISIVNTDTGDFSTEFTQQTLSDGINFGETSTPENDISNNEFVSSQNGLLIVPACLQDCSINSNPADLSPVETADPEGSESINRSFEAVRVNVNVINSNEYNGLFTVTTTTRFVKKKGDLKVNVFTNVKVRDYIPRLPIN